MTNLGDRKTYIGASDASRILKNPLAVYREKIGEAPPFEGNYRTRKGTHLEPFVAAEYEATHGVKLVTPEVRVHPQYPFIRAHLDRVIEGMPQYLEIKTTFWGAGFGDPGTDEVPEQHRIQAAVQMACAPEMERCILPVDVGHGDMAEYYVPRNTMLINVVIPTLVTFWECVQRREPPAPVSNEQAAQRWPKSQAGKSVEATDAIFAIYEKLTMVRDAQEKLDIEQEAFELTIKEFMRDADELTYHQRKLCTWKTSNPKRFDQTRFATEHPELIGEYKREGAPERKFLLKKEA